MIYQLAIGTLCLATVLQMIWMARWHRAMQRENDAVRLEVKAIIRAWRDHGEQHGEISRQLNERIPSALPYLGQAIPPESIT